ncbi:MAG: hypothetical protein AAFU79_11025 [Myxococcota bacterium]
MGHIRISALVFATASLSARAPERVSVSVLEGGVGYLVLRSVDRTVEAELLAALAASARSERWIVDLRFVSDAAATLVSIPEVPARTRPGPDNGAL